MPTKFGGFPWSFWLYELTKNLLMEYDNFRLPKTLLSSTCVETISPNAINTNTSPIKWIHLSQHPQSMHQTKIFAKGIIHTSKTL